MSVQNFEKKWTNSNLVLNTKTIVGLTNGRVSITSIGDLVIQSVNEWDKSAYVLENIYILIIIMT